jgi:hypothetical protein
VPLLRLLAEARQDFRHGSLTDRRHGCLDRWIQASPRQLSRRATGTLQTGDHTMRKVSVLLCLAGLTLCQIGCIFSFDVKRCPHHRQVIELDGEIYVVDVKTQRVRKIDLDSAIEVESATEIELEVDDD